jgi:site-specific recombinase XerD
MAQSALRTGGAEADLSADPFEVLARWRTWLEVSGRYSDVTIRLYWKRVSSSLCEMLSDPDRTSPRHPLAIDEDDVARFLRDLGRRGAAPTEHVKALRCFYAWCSAREMCRNPMARITPRKKKYGRAPYLTEEELQRILDAADEVDPRARWAIQLAYATGGRADSLVNVEPSDIDWSDPAGPMLSFRIAKADKPYSVPLGPKAQEAARRLLELMDYTPLRVKTRRPTLFGVGYNAFHKWVQDASRRSGVYVHPHLLRHTFGTVLARDAQVAEITWITLMNHQDGSMLRRYASAADSDLR